MAETLKVWNLETGKEQFTFIGHNYMLTAVAITPNSKQVICGAYDDTLKVWNLETGSEQFTLFGYNYKVNPVAITPNGKTGDFCFS